MLLITPLAVLLLLIPNTLLLGSVSRYRRALARRADLAFSRLSSEPCAVSGSWSSRRQPRSLSPFQHRPPAARPATHTSGSRPRTVTGAPAFCSGVCGFDAGAQRQDTGIGWRGDAEDVAEATLDGYVKSPTQLYGKRSTQDGGGHSFDGGYPPAASVRKDAAQPALATGPSRTRLARSLDATFPYKEEGNSSSSSTDSKRFSQLPQEDGDPQSTNGTLVGGINDYSGEVETSLLVGGASAWGTPVPPVPASWMTALYFGRRQEQLQVKPTAGLELPRTKFSLELWVKPEGGQSNPSVIAGGRKVRLL